MQARLEQALQVALRVKKISLTVAGRTDSGVHALGQVASFSFDGEMPDTILRSLNGLTPRGIAVRAVTPASGFDARTGRRLPHLLLPAAQPPLRQSPRARTGPGGSPGRSTVNLLDRLRRSDHRAA